jgi:hypothetical protein
MSLAGYMVFGDKILDVRRVFEAELVEIGGLDRPDAAFAGDERAPECIAGKADWADHADASDDYAGHVLTFRRGPGLGFDQMGDAGDHLRNVLNLLGLFVINFDVELAFEIEKDIKTVEGINAQFFEAAFRVHGLQRNPPGVGNNPKDTVLNRIRHKRNGAGG